MQPPFFQVTHKRKWNSNFVVIYQLQVENTLIMIRNKNIGRGGRGFYGSGSGSSGGGYTGLEPILEDHSSPAHGYNDECEGVITNQHADRRHTYTHLDGAYLERKFS